MKKQIHLCCVSVLHEGRTVDLCIYTVYMKGIHCMYSTCSLPLHGLQKKANVGCVCTLIMCSANQSSRGFRTECWRWQTQLAFSQYKATSYWGMFFRLGWQARDLHWWPYIKQKMGKLAEDVTLKESQALVLAQKIRIWVRLEASVKLHGKPLPSANTSEKNRMVRPGVCSRVWQTWKWAGKEE